MFAPLVSLVAWSPPGDTPRQLIAGLAILAVPLLFLRTLRACLLFWSPFVPVLLAYAIYPWVFRRLPGSEFWTALFQTSAIEAVELMDYLGGASIALAAGSLLYLVSALLQEPIALPRWTRLFALLLVCGSAVQGAEFLGRFPASFADDAYVAWNLRPGEGPSITLARIERRTPAREVFVLVIGESARRDIYYEVASTNAAWNRRAEIIKMSCAISQAGMTRFSVPALLSGTFSAPGPRIPDLISFAQAAGFRVVWVNANDVQSPWAHGAEALIERRGEPDSVLTEEVRSHLADSQHLLVVLHTSGSHVPYERRYDALQAPFPAGTGSGKERMLAAYRNSIDATHEFQEDLFELLDADAGEVFVAYVSDHGENLLDDERLLTQHGFGSRYEYEIPMVFWANAMFIQNNVAAWASLKQNSDAAVTSADLLPTFKQAMGISTAVDNGLMGAYVPYPRFVQFNQVLLPFDAIR